MFEEITDKNKIKNMLELLKRAENLVRLRNNLNEFSGFINEVTDNYFLFFSKFKIQNLEKKVVINFINSEKYYYFETTVIKSDKTGIYLDVPEKIFLHIKRRFKRYNLKGYDVRANIKVITLKTKEYFFLTNTTDIEGLKEIYEEYKKDVPDIKKILKLLILKLSKIYDKVDIKLTTHPDERNIISRIIKITHKPFFISNTFLKNSYLQNVYYPEIVSYKNYFDLLKNENVSDSKIEQYILNRINYYRKINIISEIYYPIILEKNFLGYIRVANTKKNITKPEVNNIGNIVNLFVEAMIKAKLNSTAENDSIQLKVNDISLAGIGMLAEDKLLIEHLDTDIKIKVKVITLGKELCNFIGEVKRKILHKNNAIIGLEITEILPTQKLKLENFISKYFENPEP